MSIDDNEKLTGVAAKTLSTAPIIEAPKRTECACATCVQCCKDQPGALAPGDYERIRDHLRLTDAEARELFRSSEGAVVQTADLHQRRQRTIVPLYNRHRRRCVFLSDDDKCGIHEVKPAGCAMFDTHMDAGKSHAISYWLIMQQADAAYQERRRELKISDHYKPKRY